MVQGRPIPTTTHNAYRAKVSDGKSVKVVAGENTESGLFYEFSGFFGSAMQSVEKDEEVILTIEQAEFETDQIVKEDDFEVGDILYFKDGKFTVSGEDSRQVGRVTQGKDDKNVIWFILGPQA